MLILKLFLPMSTPGLAALGLGLVGAASGTYNAIEVIAIFLGLAVVAVAGVFTIRSNVAKIWREQAEGEKARNAVLVAELAETVKDHAADLAALTLEKAAREAELARLRSDLDDAHRRTDLTPCLELLHQILQTVSAPVEVTGEHGGPIQIERASR